MSERIRRRLERIDETLKRLREQASLGKPIIVEGRNDILALKELGVEGNFLPVKSSGWSFLYLTDNLVEKGVGEVILLLDFDRRGRESTRLLKRQLEKNHVKIDLSFWVDLNRSVGRDVKDIEGLITYVKGLKRRAGIQHSLYE